MTFMKIPKYVKHETYRDSANGRPGVHAMKRGPTVLVDSRAFLCADLTYDDAFYPDEPDSPPWIKNALVTVEFSKGSACCYLDTKASELARVLGAENVPEEWLGRYGRRDALNLEPQEPRV